MSAPSRNRSIRRDEWDLLSWLATVFISIQTVMNPAITRRLILWDLLLRGPVGPAWQWPSRVRQLKRLGDESDSFKDQGVQFAGDIVEKVVDIADFAVSNDPDCTLVTYSLGSCIGLSIWDPHAKVAGLLHYMLPDSAIAPDKAQSKPCMFADTGIPLLFKGLYQLGGQKRRLVVKLAGGSQLMDAQGTFNIGKRNHLALRKILWRNNVMIDTEDVGGNEGRTMRIQIATGVIRIKSKNREYEL